jgi:peptidoglycan/xylan/chitin deacetylase (PgdA/CDA1 family)
MSQAGNAPAMAVFYHRVADSDPNDWTIGCQEFKRHLDFFAERFDLVSIADTQQRVDQGSRRPSLSITFDDGYHDNVDFALPLLIERQIPCTYFVTTGNVIHQRPFAHDLARDKPLAINNAAQIRRWSDAGIEMGCHTRSHVDFSKVQDPAEIHREVAEAKDELEQIIGKPVRQFAFPYGMPQQLTPAAIWAVQEAGFHGFCSAFGGYNLVGRDSFHIRRFHGDPEFSRLVNWCSFDQSKVDREPLVIYSGNPKSSSQLSVPAVATR